MSEHCAAGNCDRLPFDTATDGCCIFHTETGKIREDKEKRKIFTKSEDRNDIEKSVVTEFIDSFSALLEEKREVYNSTGKRMLRNLKLPRKSSLKARTGYGRGRVV